MFDPISALTAPFVPLTNRCFENISKYVAGKHKNILKSAVNHDFKVMMFNTTSSLFVGIVVLGYYKKIALVVAVVLAVLFYLVRRLIGATIAPVEIPKESPDPFQAIKEQTLAILPGRAPPSNTAPAKSLKEKVVEFFYQGDDLIIARLVILKTTYYPLPRMIGMIFTRTT